MADPLEALARLDQLARELDKVSRTLAGVERELEPVEAQYVAATEEHLLTLHRAALAEGIRLPREEVTTALAREAMPERVRVEYDHLMALRRRGERRLSGLKAAVDAQRSILSALKAELEAVEG